MLTQADIDRYSWFHGINFGHVRSKGRVTPDNWSLYGIMSFMENVDFTGLRVLDIGTMDGLIAFIAEREGAAEVVCTDLYDRGTFRLAKRALGSHVAYYPRTNIEDLLGVFGAGSFDIVVMGGLLYHLVSPVRGILNGRFLLKTGGLLLLETVTCEGDASALRFNLGEPVMDEYTTYFVPTIRAVSDMMSFAMFDVLGTSRANPLSPQPYARSSFVGCAVYPGCPTTPLMQRAQDRAMNDDRILDGFRFAKLKTLPSTSARVDDTAIGRASQNIDIRTFRTRFDLQPDDHR